MKRFITLLFSSVLAATSVLAQQEYAHMNISGLALPENTISTIKPVVDDDGLTGLAFVRGGSFLFAVVSPAGDALIQQKAPLALTGSSEIIGTVSTEKSFIYLVQQTYGNGNAVIPISIDKATAAVTRLPVVRFAVEQDAKFIASIADGNSLYLLFFRKKTSMLQVGRLEGVQAMELKNYPIAPSYAKDLFNVTDNWTALSGDLDKTILSGLSKKKIYMQEGKIVFLADALPSPGRYISNITHLMTLELRQDQVFYNTFNFPLTKYEYSTYLHGRYLFKFLVNADELILEVYDAESQSLLNVHRYSGSEKIAIKASPLYESKGEASAKVVSKFNTEDTESIIYSLSIGIPTITLERTSGNTLVLLLGSYIMRQGGGGGMMMPAGGGVISTPYGTASLPVSYHYVGNPGMLGNGKVRSTYFEACLDVRTLEKVKDKVQPGMQERLDEYEKQLKDAGIKVGATALVRNHDKLYYSYTDKKARMLKIVTFSI